MAEEGAEYVQCDLTRIDDCFEVTRGMDYVFMGQAEQEGQTEIMVIKDGRSGTLCSHVVRVKGPGDEWIVGRICKDIKNMAYNIFVLN